uniref:paxillin-like n=1 Tax=Myxine glutinosa TaxID=7769 RepID=UPI0035900880
MATFGSSISELDLLLQELNDSTAKLLPTQPSALSHHSDDIILGELKSNTLRFPSQSVQVPDTMPGEVWANKLEDSGRMNIEQLQKSEAEESKQEESQHRVSASCATRDLDELMTSLSDFKIQNNVNKVSPPEVKPSSENSPSQSTKLSSMLDNLQSDLHRQGVTTQAKGICAACNKPVVGQVLTAMGKQWHPEHFVCAHCSTEIGSKNFFEHNGQPYCEQDYYKLFSPQCAFCKGPIVDKVVTALEKTWHPEHFLCAACGKHFGEEGFHEKEGKPYCRSCFLDVASFLCAGCSTPILDNYISAINAFWHPHCFVCRECFIPFVNGSFFEHNGLPYCETHYHAHCGSLCAGCHKPIAGRCISAMGHKFHPEHFVCAFCLKQLNKGMFKERNDKPYCHTCCLKLFGPNVV